MELQSRTCLRMALILVTLTLLSACNPLILTTLFPQQGQQAEVIRSPSGRYTAQLWRCSDFSDYISGFDIYDQQTLQIHRQDLSRVAKLSLTAGGLFFQWTPSEDYLVLVTDNQATSHGCDEVLIYSGDGDHLVYTSSTATSVCSTFLDADSQLTDIQLCPNDVVIYTIHNRTYQVIPQTAEVVTAAAPKCPR